MKSNSVLMVLALSASVSAFANTSVTETLEHSAHDMQNTHFRDHDAVVANCGVGNYTFRKEATCAANTVSVQQKDAVTSAQSSSFARSAAKAVAAAPIATTVYFDTASAKLTPASAAKVAQLVRDLKAKGFAAVEIETLGFADARGSEASNMKLSEARAASAAKALSMKVKTAKIASEGRGEGFPAVKDPTSWENRRVEILVRSVE